MISSVYLKDNELILLDQTLIPNETKFLKIENAKELWEAINKLRVRGAPAIGIAAGYGIYIQLKNTKANTYAELYKEFKSTKDYLATARPTAVNLCWALNRMDEVIQNSKERTVKEIIEIILQEANKIKEEDIESCKQIGEYALSLLKPNWGLLTHCNAGAIATSQYGTALSAMILGQERGYDFKVYADETRPLLQGARLTTWELNEAGVDVTLICDNMAATVMKQGKIQAVLVGADRIALNGDTANKIGTNNVAILANYYKVPFYICAPISTIDFDCLTGDDIEIEERPDEEIYKTWYEKPMAPKDIKFFNPAFDVTDNELITGIITEKGILKPPYKEKILSLKNKL
jgi:methylthioribose-1-phosphate isomerase